MEKKQPLLAVRPRFDQGLVIAESIVAGVVGVVASTFLLGTFFFIILNIIGLGRFISAAFLYNFFFLLGLVAVPAAYFELKKAAYKRTVYHFHEDYLEYQDFKFLLSRRRGRIRLRDITDVFERANPLQSRRVLTTLYLIVPGMNIPVRGGFSGIRIPDVPENSGLSEKILELVEESNRRYYQPRQPAYAPPIAPTPAAQQGRPDQTTTTADSPLPPQQQT